MNPPPSPEQAEAIRSIQRRVRAMLDERQALGPGAEPSRYWTDFCRYFDYLLDLAPAAFGQLRLHTYHLTGDNYQTYYFGKPGPFLDYWGPWLATEGLPAEHILSEPPDGIGFRLDDGRFVSQDVARFQRTVAALSRHHVLSWLATLKGTARVVEIGGGYGGLVWHLARILPQARFVVVDLPETLIFSAAYLTLQAPERRVHLYDPTDPLPAGRFDEFDILLWPDYKLDDLLGLEFDLALNVASMQEMRVDQVERYLDFLQRTCGGTFYSCNRDRQAGNAELPGLFDLIRTRFTLTELPPLVAPDRSLRARTRRHLKRSLRRVAQAVGLAEPGDPAASDPFPFVEHLGQGPRDFWIEGPRSLT